MKQFIKDVLETTQKGKGNKVQGTVTTKQLIVTTAVVGGIAYLSGNAKAYKQGYVDGVNTLGDRFINMLKEYK